jgi:hypothetical protein
MFFFNHQAWVEGEGKVTFWWIQHGLAPICTSKFLFLHPKKWTKKKGFFSQILSRAVDEK